MLLRRFPGLLAAVVGAGFVLAVASASQPLFISSAGNAAVHASLHGLCPWTAGMQISTLQPLSGAPAAGNIGQEIPSDRLFPQRDAFIDRVAAGVPGLGRKVVTIFGSVAVATSPVRPHVAPLVRLMSRDRFRSNIQVVSGSGGPGVWVPNDWARPGGVEPGDPIDLQIDGNVAHTRVAGVYRSLLTHAMTPFWCSQETEIYGLDPNSSPPSVLLTDQATMLALSKRIEDGNALISWEFPIRDPRGITLEAAQAIAAGTLAAERQLQAGPFFHPQSVSQIQSVVPQVMTSLDQIRSPAASVALAGRLVALLVLAAVGVYWLDRRRTEAALLSAKGVGPLGIASKASLEVVLPLAVASVAGWFAAIRLVRWLGPGSLLSPNARSAALTVVVWTAFAGLVLLAVAVGATVRGREVASAGGAPGGSVLSRTPWEVVILLLMAASLYEVLTRGGGTVTFASGQTKVDVLLILFPILFVAGGAGLAARGLRRLLPRLKRLGSRRSPAVFLASRRLAAASGIALGLVTAVAFAVGILAYAGTLSASTRASATAKAEVFVGSDVRATLLHGARVPAPLRPTSTVVIQDGGVRIEPGDVVVNVLGVDTSTFARGAFWDRSFSDRSLADLLRDLAAPRLPPPAIVVGGSVPRTGAIGFTRLGTTVPYRVLATVRAFPLQTQNETFVIMDARHLTQERKEMLSYLLAKGSGAHVVAALSRAQVPFRSPVTADEVGANPTVIALTWLYGYLLGIAVATGLIVLVALVLYLAARQRGRIVSYALARRMGLRASEHRRSLGLEIAGMLLIGFALGTVLAAFGAWLVFARLDPLPNLPPPALFRLPWALVGGSALVLVVASWIGARLVQWSAERADVAEVMRVGA
jgi:putative ABC transport system permease protein